MKQKKQMEKVACNNLSLQFSFCASETVILKNKNNNSSGFEKEEAEEEKEEEAGGEGTKHLLKILPQNTLIRI